MDIYFRKDCWSGIPEAPFVGSHDVVQALFLFIAARCSLMKLLIILKFTVALCAGN